MITHDLFIAAFTGAMTTYTSPTTKLFYSFHQPYPRIVKGRGYIMELNEQAGKIRMLPIIS